MPTFLAMTSRGLGDCLQAELTKLGVEHSTKIPGGVVFQGNWETCYRANLNLRTATRIVMPVLDFPAYQYDDIYHNCFKKHDFTKYLGLNDTFSVRASARSHKLKDQRLVGLKLKDAIADQFREKFDRRPDVSKDAPDVQFNIRVSEDNKVSVAVDTTGESLHMRGYRSKDTVDAPLKEHLAAALVQMTGWDGTVPIIDLMCGSGTLLIEAAFMARNIAPGSFRRRFSFQKFQTYDKSLWEKVVEETVSQEKEQCETAFYGFDRDRKAVRVARQQVDRVELEECITIQRSNVDMVEPPVEKGLIIVNPPYGERLGHPEELKDVYRDLSYVLKSKFKGWTCWVLSGNQDCIGELKLKSSAKFRVFNGPIECRFLKYEIR